jgi:DMSO reductase anchor subunit
MHPAFSVIFFTVTSGAGYGLFAITALYHALSKHQVMTSDQILLSSGIALALITAGLISSTFHLANPKNAWRAFSRVRTSWLAREGLLAILFYPIAFAYLFFVWSGLQGALVNGTAILGAVWAITTVFSTGMIYACLKTIRQWNNALTPVNYILLGVMLGAIIYALVASMGEGMTKGVITTSAYIIAAAAISKLIYFFWVGAPAGSTINTATSFTSSMVRLLDVGHTAGTFLTDEFGYQVARHRLIALRWIVAIFAFGLPAIMVWLSLSTLSVTTAYMVALLSAFAGVVTERWLFFAEARHVVNLYHGSQQC